MTYYVAGLPYSAELYHHGIKGQKWGIRRYQNADGTLTDTGIRRYGTVENYQNAQRLRSATRDYNRALSKAYRKTGLYITDRKRQKSKDAWNNVHDAAKNYKDARSAFKSSNKAAINDPKYKEARRAHRSHILNQGMRLTFGVLNAASSVNMYSEAFNRSNEKGYRIVAGIIGTTNAATAKSLFSAYMDNKKK